MMNVHGTHAAIGPTEKLGAHAKPSGVKNDCQIQTAEFAHMLTQLIDKPHQPSVDGAGAPDGAGPSRVKPGR